MLRPHRQWMPGWWKIQMCCRQALGDGLSHVWVDTCCIDKNSSAELSEAINSMFMWYADADRCYAYLSDITETYMNFKQSYNADAPVMPDLMAAEIVDSLWFTRAWTLQELIAPRHLTFYDASFRRLCTKTDIPRRIEEIHRVPVEVLVNRDRLWTIPVAVRLSWAARRKATRTEDIAYSLFGIFNVNLPLLYGEGMKAFARLQEEIIRQTHDHSIFVWSSASTLEDGIHKDTVALPLLASSPADFASCQDVLLPREDDDVRPYALTNIGLEIELKIFPYDLDVYVALLHCVSGESGHQYAFLLTKQSERASRWSRARVKGVDRLVIKDATKLRHFVWQKMYVAKLSTGGFMGTNTSSIQDMFTLYTTFYGLHLDAPDLLTYSTDTGRPYCLVAHNNWDYTPDRLQITEDDKYSHFQSGYTADLEARLTPTSHFGLTIAIEQTLTLTRGMRRLSLDTTRAAHGSHTSQHPLKRHFIEAKDQQRSQDAAIALGVLAMPLLTTGTAGIIAFDHLVHGVRAIKAGLDFYFRPIIFIAMHVSEVDPRLQTWMQSRRHIPLKHFEKNYSMLDSLRKGEGTSLWTSQFWSLELDAHALTRDHVIREDGYIEIQKGLYAFTSTGNSTTNHWVFKPYENQPWHLAVELEKRRRDGLVYWEVSIHKRDDPVKLEIVATPYP